MKQTKYCIRCNANDWQQTWKGFGVEYKCKKCGYIFDWVNYLTAGKIKTNQITASKIELKSLLK